MTPAAARLETEQVVIVGGGITGLAAAYELAEINRTRSQAQPPLDITLLEGSRRLGGKIHTTAFMGRPVDEGADAFITRVPHALELAQRLGELRPIAPAAGGALVLNTRRRTALRRLPTGLVLGVPTSLVSLARSRLVGLADLAQMSLDLMRKDNWPGPNETIGELTERRLGREVSQAVVSPLLSSINAGDIDQLEARSAAPQLAAAARQGGSLIRSLRASLKASLRAQKKAAKSSARISQPATQPAQIFASFEGGMGELTDALTQALEQDPAVKLRTDVSVSAIELAAATEPHRLNLTASSETIRADSVVLATPAHAAQQILNSAAPATATQLAQIEYASVAIVTLGFDRSQIAERLSTAGMLVPKRESMLTTAASFGSAKWPHWAEDDKAVLRVSVGRHKDERALELGDEQLASEVMSELAPLLGIAGEPIAWRISRWEKSLPQYLIGHQSRVAQIRKTLAAELPGVLLAGAAYEGLGIPACIAQAKQAALTLTAVGTQQ